MSPSFRFYVSAIVVGTVVATMIVGTAVTNKGYWNEEKPRNKCLFQQSLLKQSVVGPGTLCLWTTDPFSQVGQRGIWGDHQCDISHIINFNHPYGI